MVPGGRRRTSISSVRVRSKAPMPSIETTVACGLSCVRLCTRWATHSVPALVDSANWKGAVSILPKLLWLQRHEPDALESAVHVLLGAADYLFARLTRDGGDGSGDHHASHFSLLDRIGGLHFAHRECVLHLC